MAGGGSSSSTKVVQVTNIAPQATKDQNIFGNIGQIDRIRLCPTVRDVSCPVQSRICYVKYLESSCVPVAQHLTNTVFIDRALIVIPMQNIPNEYRALEMSKNGTIVPGLQGSRHLTTGGDGSRPRSHYYISNKLVLLQEWMSAFACKSTADKEE